MSTSDLEWPRRAAASSDLQEEMAVPIDLAPDEDVGATAARAAGLGRAGRQAPVSAWARALRPHQWAKNLLLFVPVTLAGSLAGWADFLEAGVGFVIFGLLASAGYVINDLLDLEADRQHRTKRFRPFAAGELSARAGACGVAALIVGALALSVLMPLAFLPAALGYFVGTLTYSLALKREPMVDTLMLAALFTVRVLAGSMVLAMPVSFWLLTFSMFLFLSLALIKRYTELADLASSRTSDTIPGRGYGIGELPLLLSMGSAAAIAANVIFLIYVIEEKFPSNLYADPAWLWLIFPLLLLWLMHMWRVAVQGRMHEDPVFFALKDRLSLVLGAVTLGLLLLAR